MFVNLTTERLLLRELKESDSKNLFEIRSDECVNKYIDRKSPENIQAVTGFIQSRNSDIANGKCCYWAISFRNDPEKLIGTICLWNFNPGEKSAELGYELHPHFQGEGLMNEAVGKVISFAKDSGFEKLEAITHRNNGSSISLLEKNRFRCAREFKESPEMMVYEKKLDG